jgi:hypothetical protein
VSNGTNVPYHLRQNKFVERQLFLDLLAHASHWEPIKDYLYVGFGGFFFEDFKLVHDRFGINKMLSIEKMDWAIPRQHFNLPYGCIQPNCTDSAQFIDKLSQYRQRYPENTNLLCWLDYATWLDIADQLNEVKALLLQLVANDIIKVTLVAHPSRLDAKFSGLTGSLHEKRYEVLKNILGSQFLGDGFDPDQLGERRFPEVISTAFQMAIAGAMKESGGLIFQPLGSYVYKDGTQMITFTGIILDQKRRTEFLEKSGLQEFSLASLKWERHLIAVPSLSIKEKLTLDRLMHGKDAVKIAEELKVKVDDDERIVLFDEDADVSAERIGNYLQYYRYYPNFLRVQF